jgi:hypothetical protein
MDIMKEPHAIVEDCTNWNLYYKTSVIGLGVCTPQSVKCQWMSHWWCRRDGCLGMYTSPQNEIDLQWNYNFNFVKQSCYVWNFIIYVGLDTTLDDYLGNEHLGSKAVLELSIRDTMWLWTISFEALICIVSYTANRLRPWEHCVKVESAKQNKEGKIWREENVPVYKDKLMNMKRKDEKDIYLMSITHDKKLVQTRVQDKTSRSPE